MDFFGGDFKSKRNINLGGKKVLKKDELLQRTQLERQKRELERQRNRCALKIQSWYRSRRCAIVVKSACRAEWDALWNALASETSVSSEVIQKLVSLFLFFFVPTYDRRRLQGLVRYLTLPASDIGSLNLAIPVMTPLLELQHNWYRNLGRLIECLRRTIITSKMNADLLHESIEFLWQITHNPVFNIRGLFGTGLLEFVIRNGVYDILRQLVDFENLDSQTAVRVVSISFWPLLQYRDNSEYLQPSLKYFVTFLFVPSLLSKLSSQAAKFTEDFPVELIASYLLQNPLYIRELRASNADNNTVHLLSNFISILKEKMLAGEVDQTSVVQLLLLLLQDMKEANSDFFEESSEELSISPMGEMIASSPIFTTVTNGRVKNDMDFLYDKSFIAFLSRILMSEHSELDKGPVCSLLCLLLHLRPSKKKEIVRYILYNSKKSVLLALYECVRSSIFYSNISSTLNQFEEFSQLHMSPLFLLSEVLVDHLNLLGDDEFFNENKFLPLHAVLDISALFRDVCFTLFWEGVADVYLKSVGQHLHWYRSMFSRILMEIYLRDSRRNFCPENFWIKLQDVDVDAFADIFSFDDEEMSEMEHRGLNSQQVKKLLLLHIPFVIAFESRVKIFREWIRRDRESLGFQDEGWLQPLARVRIRRQHIFEDGFTSLNNLSSNLKGRVAITFISDQGLEEAGIDGGGVFKEFLTCLSEKAFDPSFGLFLPSESHQLYPAPASDFEGMQLKYLEFVGRIIGKAMYDGILTDTEFSPFFLAKWLGRLSYLDDLSSLDKKLYDGLIFLKNYQPELVKDLGLTFAIEEEIKGQRTTVDLVPNGADVPVTKDNRFSYIYRVANYKLNERIARQCRAFFHGLSDLVNPRWLRLFNQKELQIMLSGANLPIDIEDMKRNITYGGDFHELHPTIVKFWSVVEEFSEDDRVNLVRFITSCPRPPLLGFKELLPSLCIRCSGDDIDRLPTASTCVNLLKMPAYTSIESMRDKLLYAIQYGAGFELS